MDKKIILPGEPLTDNQSFIKGHGTHAFNTQICSSILGTPTTINKLLTVIPKFTSSYTSQIGDVIIGRVTNIFNKKWKIEANSHNEITMHLSAINLPGVEQRRKLEEDEMRMREFFNLGDLLVCEVQKVSKNGSVAVHTRNEKCKKLCDGVVLEIPLMICKRFKSQFLEINRVEIIIGMNGLIWISGDLNRIGKFVNYFNECSENLTVINEDDIKSL